MIFLFDFLSSFSSIISNLQLESLKPKIRKTSHSANKKISVYGGFYVLIRLAHHDLEKQGRFQTRRGFSGRRGVPRHQCFLGYVGNYPKVNTLLVIRIWERRFEAHFGSEITCPKLLESPSF